MEFPWPPRASCSSSRALIHAAVLFCLLVSSSSQSPSGSNTTDRLALLSFKSLISPPSRALESWNDTTQLCNWQGVTCGQQNPRRVTALVLDSFNLSGLLSPFLANLTFLETLQLPSNRFHGAIPQELGRLPRLRQLNLYGNSLEGGIPASLTQCWNLQILNMTNNPLGGSIPAGLSNCSGLHVISLQNNSLAGVIPPDLGLLNNLTQLDLSLNLLGGGIPPSLGNLSSLTYLDLTMNTLTGGIPASLGGMVRLNFSGLSLNGLTGEIPPSLYNLSSLYFLGVGDNRLSGRIPQDIGTTLPKLQYLYMFNNSFDGPLPASLANVSQLQELTLSVNSFSGTVPSNLGARQNLRVLQLDTNQLEAKEPKDWDFLTSLTNCTNLNTLFLQANKFGGVLPNSIANLSTQMEQLSIGGNLISGSIPPEIQNLASLTIFDTDKNLLTGNIPASIGNLQKLQVLYLSRNRYSGQIPSSLGRLTDLIELYLEENDLSGTIPTSFGSFKRLGLLNVSYNQLTGAIPKEVVSLSSLSLYLDLSHNYFDGSLPLQVSNLNNLGRFDVSDNRLSGEIPVGLGNCLVLEHLYMQGNFFQGALPSSLMNLQGLQDLDLSRNNLSGNIPDFLEGFRSLRYLNLSFNNFVGEVPKEGAFSNVSAISVLGNNMLCGGNPNLQLPSCSPQANQNGKSSTTLKIVMAVVGAVTGLVLLFLLLAILYRRKNSRRKPSHIPSLDNQFIKVSYEDLFKATDGFSTASLIGMGSFGMVYKGFMDDYGIYVAVKVFRLQHQGALRSFMAECETLRNVRHRNLVKIITSCSSIDFQGNEFRALVYEFVSNGNLDQWLHVEEHEKSEKRNLNLLQILNIAIDVASALDYLHKDCQVPVVHCDLKPSNILLDDKMTACVGDFGLARFHFKTVCEPPQNSNSSFGIKGSIGYIAPEYGTGLQVSTRGDVYSYGIILLEMLIGKRPTDDMFVNGLSLRKFVAMNFPNKIVEIVDPNLLSHEADAKANDETKHSVWKCLISIAQVGLLCSEDKPEKRIEMRDVVNELHYIKESFLGGYRSFEREE